MLNITQLTGQQLFALLATAPAIWFLFEEKIKDDIKFIKDHGGLFKKW